MNAFAGLVLLLVAAVLAVAGGAVMGGAVRPGLPSRDGPGSDEGNPVGVLLLASSAVGAGTAGAAALSSGELSVSGLAPFVLPVLVVLTPLAVAARRGRVRAERRRGAGTGLTRGR